MKALVNLSYFETDTLNTLLTRLNDLNLNNQGLIFSKIGSLSFFDFLTNLTEDKFEKFKELNLNIQAVYLPIEKEYAELTAKESETFLTRLKELKVKTILIRPVFSASSRIELKKELIKLKWQLRKFKVVFALKESSDQIVLKNLIDKKIKFQMYFDPVYFYLNNLGSLGHFKIFFKYISLLRLVDIDESGKGEFLNFGIFAVNEMAKQLKVHGRLPILVLDSMSACFFETPEKQKSLNKKSRNVQELQLLNEPSVNFLTVLKSEFQAILKLSAAIES